MEHMSNIRIYDDDMKVIAEICEANSITPADVIAELVRNFLWAREEAKRR